MNIICQKDDDSDDNNAVSRAFLTESRSYFNFYISKEDEGKRWQKTGTKQNGPQGTFNQSGGTGPAVTEQDDEDTRDGLPFDGRLADETRTDPDCDFLSHFNIPNFITCEQNSSLGEDDPLCGAPITPDRNM